VPVFAFESTLLSWVQSWGQTWLDGFMAVVSGRLVWMPLVAAAAWGLGRKHQRRERLMLGAFALLLLAVVDSTTSYFFKNLVARLRPCKMPEYKAVIRDFGQGCGGRWGFFSSHAANAAALTHFLLPFLPTHRLTTAGAWAFVLLVAFSRVYLGVHFPLDVLAGLAWGTALAHGWGKLAANALKGRAAP
jgi:undecaprenyl-diphosphatase